MAKVTLKGRHILVVEDDYLLASCLADTLTDIGVSVIGPVGTIEDATNIISASASLHGAILDLNLHGKMSFGIADLLASRKIAFVFMTGYDKSMIPERFQQVGLCRKPFSIDTVVLAITKAIHNQP